MNSEPRRIISLTLLAIMMFSSLPSPSLAMAQVNEKNVKSQAAANKPPAFNLPPFPEDKNRGLTDWSKVDFEQEISLMSDSDAYFQKIAELEKMGKRDEIKNLKKATHHLWDEDIMAHNQVPESIRGLIRDYRKNFEGKLQEKTANLPAEQVSARKKLQQNIYTVLQNEGYYDKKVEQSPDNVIDLKDPNRKKLKIKKAIPSGTSSGKIEVEIPKNNNEKDFKKQFTLKKPTRTATPDTAAPKLQSSIYRKYRSGQ